MAGKLSFSIAINLLTENFKKGTNQVKAGFKAMQMQVVTFAAALGAGGIGLSNLVSRFVDVARETNRVSTALKNVSGSMSQYADNQRFLVDMAKKYGLEINALTGNFAKFTASASASNMSMEEQRKIFESVSRAVTAFGMSAEDSNGVFLALSQMMSKGKISSEELRLQMGERLPIALQAMAKAAGTSVAGLDKLLKEGKLMSADVLPKFADALNEMIPNVDTNNLETSVNRLKNIFTELVNSMDVQGKYKSLVDWLAGALDSLKGKISGIFTFIIGIISGKLLLSVTKYFTQFWKLIDTTISKNTVAQEQMKKATEARVAAELAYQKTLADNQQIVDGRRLASNRQLAAAERALNNAKLAEKKANDIAEAASANAAAVQTSNSWAKSLKSIKLGFVQLWRTITGLFKSFLPIAIISGISALISYLVEARKEATRIKNIFADYKKEVAGALSSTSAEVAQLRVLQGLYNKAAGNKKLQEQYQKRIEGIVGQQITKEQNINDIIAKRIKLLEATATADFYTQKKIETEEKNRTLGISSGIGEQNIRHLATVKEESRGEYWQKVKAITGNSFTRNREIDKIVDEYSQNLKVIGDVNKRLEDAVEYVVKSNTQTTIIDDLSGSKSKKKTTLQKQQESYYRELEELNAELGIGKITQAEYNKALGELNIKMYAQARGTRDKQTLESEYYRALKTAADEAVSNRDRNAALVEFERVQKEYNERVKEAQNQQAKGVLSQEQLNKNIVSLSVEAAKAAAGIKGIGDNADGFIAAMQFNAQAFAAPIKVKPRDTTFDYKKTQAEIAQEELDKAKEIAQAYKEYAASLGKDLSDELANAMANVPDLEKKLKIAQVKQDVKDFTKELNEGLYSGIKDVASSSDRVVSAFENLRDVMNDVDATAWEQIMAIWNAMTNTVDSILSVIHTVESIARISEKLSGAKEQESPEEHATKIVAAKAAEVAANEIATESEIQASRRKTESAAAEMAAKSTAAYAGIPFAGAGLAAAQIAAMTAMIQTAASMVPKFAQGGIITGGSTSGDKILARVNAGEMILNQRQQSNLFRAINSGNIGGTKSLSSTVTTRVRAKDLILAINNELKSQGKKPIL
jgi:tape measure domain-containing protein